MIVFMRHMPELAAYIDWPNFEKNIMAMDLPETPISLILRGKM